MQLRIAYHLGRCLRLDALDQTYALKSDAADNAMFINENKHFLPYQLIIAYHGGRVEPGRTTWKYLFIDRQIPT